MRYNVLLCVAVGNLVLANCRKHLVLQCVVERHGALQRVVVCCSVLRCVAVRCCVLQCAAVGCNVLPCVAVCCVALYCVAECYSELQCFSVCCSVMYITHQRHQRHAYKSPSRVPRRSCALSSAALLFQDAGVCIDTHRKTCIGSRSFGKAFGG